MNKYSDLAVVIGVETLATQLAEEFCKSVGIDVLYAMQLERPSCRIQSTTDSAVIPPPATQSLDLTTFVIGLQTGESLFLDGPLDCYYETEWESFICPVSFVVHRMKSVEDIPSGCKVFEAAEDEVPRSSIIDPKYWTRYNHDDLQRMHVGQFTDDGRVVVNLDGRKKWMQLPDGYKAIFPMLEGKVI